MARANKQQTQIKLPEAIKANTPTSEPELADDTDGLTEEERLLAEQSLEDDPDDFGPEGGASIGDVDPENEDASAYEGATDESDVVSEENEDDSDGDDQTELDEQNNPQDDPQDESNQPEPVDQPEPDQSSPNLTNLPAQPIRAGARMEKRIGHPVLTTERQLTNRVAILQDGDIMDGTDQHQDSAQLPKEQLPDANECLAWIDMNNLTATQQKNRTWVIYDSANNIIGAGHSLPVACHAAGMRAATGLEEVDDEVGGP